ncbi:MAG: sporulation protein YqfD [Clostridium sp.]|nr:sporulation protein YqfD [Clostridium sp.]MCM1398854.1 sporulation protein YqfD [Clostridium sp.]MCM1458515.1 sporulation protein YqfD [Bacteroides sp.]
MIKKILNFLAGYVLVSIHGDGVDRFINICMAKKLHIWSIKKDKNKTLLYVSRTDFQKFGSFVEKTGVEIHVIKSLGIPFLYEKNKKRKCFVIGFFLFLFLVWEFTTFVWDINISGEGRYSAEEIEKNIKQNYVQLGTKLTEVNCSDLEKMLRDEYSDIAWISCELKGTQLNIKLTETILPEDIEKQSKPCNIVASKDCIISDMIIKNGTGMFEAGAEVKKGDIIITGAVNIYNEYDELIETNYVPASGIVYGQSKMPYEDAFDLSHYEKNYTGKKKHYYGIIYGDNLFEPFQYDMSYNNCDIITSYDGVRIFDTFYLPLTCKKTTVSEYEPELAAYTEQEAVEKAKNKLNVYMAELKKKGVEILQNNVKIYVKDGKCIASGYLVVKEIVGIPLELSVFEQGD